MTWSVTSPATPITASSAAPGWPGCRPSSTTAGRPELRLGPPCQPGGATAWVAPARTAAGNRVVLKVGWWHDEAAHEADGLRA
jgi:hypothetical protein